MSENTSSNSSSRVAQPLDRHTERRARRDERRSTLSGRTGLAGIALIMLGLIYMLQNMGALHLNNGWALFILLPAIGSLVTAYGSYHHHGRWTAAGRGALISGLILTAVTAFFLLDVEWSKWWPLLLVLFGIGTLMNELLPG